MNCDCCGVRNANVTFNVLFGGKKIVRGYCAQCARKLKRGDALSGQMAVLNTLESDQGESAFACPQCGTTIEKIKKSGRVGCAACYRAFGSLTDRMMQKLNGTERQDADAVPMTSVLSEREKQIRALKGELAQAVSIENYERAAVLRDEINALSAQMEEGGLQE